MARTSVPPVIHELHRVQAEIKTSRSTLSAMHRELFSLSKEFPLLQKRVYAIRERKEQLPGLIRKMELCIERQCKRAVDLESQNKKISQAKLLRKKIRELQSEMDRMG